MARKAPIQISWFQQSRNIDIQGYSEARGAALYSPPGSSSSSSVVAPCDDGSLCLWDMSGDLGRIGRIIARSRPGILGVPGRTASHYINPGVTESISIDGVGRRAYVACQSRKSTILICSITFCGQPLYKFHTLSLSQILVVLCLQKNT